MKEKQSDFRTAFNAVYEHCKQNYHYFIGYVHAVLMLNAI